MFERSTVSRRLAGATGVFLILLGLLLPGAALAWKPTTHVQLAEIALQDALDDGRVTIMRVDPRTGQIAGVLGEFAVAPDILAALRAAPEQYRAGVVGPDAYPDLPTGQQIIHPLVAKNEQGVVTGSDAWLTHLWGRSYGVEAPAPVRAFVSGYLTHAAGDSFAHTYVNHFSGGAFTLDPVQNAARHMLLESYLGKRAPATSHDLPMTIEGVDGFIHDEMVAARPDNALGQRLLIAAPGPTPTFSIPLTFSNLRGRLVAEVLAYETERDRLTGAARATYIGLNGGPAEFKRYWIEDIDEGLRAWPAVSARISATLLYYPDHPDLDGAVEIMERYAEDHLWSMGGTPDWLVAFGYAPAAIARAILPQALIEFLGAAADAIVDRMIEAATGMTTEEWRGYITRPDRYFDAVMNSESNPSGGHVVTLADFNHRELGIADDAYANPDQRWTVDGFAPAFNTVQLTKLSFLDAAGLAAVERALGAPAGQGDNIMLGWLGSLDDSSQWRGDARFARPDVFDQLFRPHFGAP